MVPFTEGSILEKGQALLQIAEPRQDNYQTGRTL